MRHRHSSVQLPAAQRQSLLRVGAGVGVTTCFTKALISIAGDCRYWLETIYSPKLVCDSGVCHRAQHPLRLDQLGQLDQLRLGQLLFASLGPSTSTIGFAAVTLAVGGQTFQLNIVANTGSREIGGPKSPSALCLKVGGGAATSTFVTSSRCVTDTADSRISRALASSWASS